MARAQFQCTKPGCDQLLPHRGRCPEHERPSSTARYGSDHPKLRREWAPRVATGTVVCWRCSELIASGEPWDLGHVTRSAYGGPEHANRCNRAAAGRASHQR